MRWALLFAAYVFGAIGTFGALTAHDNEFNRNEVGIYGASIHCTNYWRKQQAGLTLAGAMIPPFWIGALFLTDVYSFGWTLHAYCGPARDQGSAS